MYDDGEGRVVCPETIREEGMNRSELYETLEILFLGLVCLNAVIVFIIPGIICRLVQDRKVQQNLNRNTEIVR